MHVIEANGARIPALGMGTWTLENEHCSEMVSAAIACGYRHIDTAVRYGNEAAVGEGIKASGLERDTLFVTTKVWWTDIAEGNLQRSAEASLKRLDMAQVDLLLIHWPNPAIPLADSVKALNVCRERGMARHIGVSNFPTSLLAQAIALSDAPLVCNQVEYHPYLDQTKVMAATRAAGMVMTSHSPLFRGGDLFAEPVIIEAAREHGKTPGQVVLRWHVQQPGVAVIPRTTKAERLKENIAIFDFSLSETEMAAISTLQSRSHRICDFDFSPKWD